MILHWTAHTAGSDHDDTVPEPATTRRSSASGADSLHCLTDRGAASGAAAGTSESRTQIYGLDTRQRRKPTRLPGRERGASADRVRPRHANVVGRAGEPHHEAS